jgi:hypothetical protein
MISVTMNNDRTRVKQGLEIVLPGMASPKACIKVSNVTHQVQFQIVQSQIALGRH